MALPSGEFRLFWPVFGFRFMHELYTRGFPPVNNGLSVA
jgi:hypothetical protein